MLEKVEYLEIENEKYPMVMTFNVLEKIQNQYGTIEKWKRMMIGQIEIKKLDKHGNEIIEYKETGEINYTAMKFFVLESINEGIDIENEKLDVKRKMVTEKQVGRIISAVGDSIVLDKITILALGSNGESEDEEGSKK